MTLAASPRTRSPWRALAFVLAIALCSPGAWAQSAAPAAAAASASEPAPDPARQLLADKCVQCHGDSMWRDMRQDQRGWTATLYRMVGRGAIWSEGEINTLAQYLALQFGPSTISSAK